MVRVLESDPPAWRLQGGRLSRRVSHGAQIPRASEPTEPVLKAPCSQYSSLGAGWRLPILCSRDPWVWAALCPAGPRGQVRWARLRAHTVGVPSPPGTRVQRGGRPPSGSRVQWGGHPPLDLHVCLWQGPARSKVQRDGRLSSRSRVQWGGHPPSQPTRVSLARQPPKLPFQLTAAPVEVEGWLQWLNYQCRQEENLLLPGQLAGFLFIYLRGHSVLGSGS